MSKHKLKQMTFVNIPEYTVVPVYIVSSTPGPHVGVACHITKLLHDPWTWSFNFPIYSVP